MSNKESISQLLDLVKDRGKAIAKYRLDNWSDDAVFEGIRIDANGSIFAKFSISARVEHVAVPTEVLGVDVKTVEETYKMLVEVPVVLSSL